MVPVTYQIYRPQLRGMSGAEGGPGLLEYSWDVSVGLDYMPSYK